MAEKILFFKASEAYFSSSRHCQLPSATDGVFILPFAFCFAAANICFTYWKEKTYVKVMVHYALTVGGAFFFLYLPNQAEDHAPAQGFIMFLALSLFYALILSVVGFVRSRIYRVKRDEKAYTSVYKKK